MDLEVTIPWLLVATPQLKDPNFHKTILVMAEHDRSGSMGLIVNRPSEIPLSDLISTTLDIPKAVPAWVGGPLETTTGFILHNQLSIQEGASAKNKEEIILSTSPEALTQLVDDAGRRLDKIAKIKITDNIYDEPQLYSFRFLAGHAAWIPGQLENEIGSGSWLQIPMNLDLLFNTPWHKMWDEAINSMGFAPQDLVPTNQSFLN